MSCTNREGLRVAVIVNDMSEVNIDADLVRDGGADLSRTEETLVELSNGCICCTLRDDLLSEVRRLAAEGRFDYLLIEGTGIAEPLPIAATFSFRDEAGAVACATSPGSTRWSRWSTAPEPPLRLLLDGPSWRIAARSRDEEDKRTLVDLLVEQIEFADVVVINKISDVSARTRAETRPHRHGAQSRRPPGRGRFRPRCRSPRSSTPACSTRPRRRPIRSGTRSSTTPARMCRRRRNTALRASSIAPGARFIRERLQAFLARRAAGPDPRQGAFLAGDAARPDRPPVNRRRPAPLRAARLLVGFRGATELAALSAVPRVHRPALGPLAGATAGRSSSSSAPASTKRRYAPGSTRASSARRTASTHARGVA